MQSLQKICAALYYIGAWTFDDTSSRIVRWRMHMGGGMTVVLCIVSGSGRKEQNNMPDCKNITLAPRPRYRASASAPHRTLQSGT